MHTRKETNNPVRTLFNLNGRSRFKNGPAGLAMRLGKKSRSPLEEVFHSMFHIWSIICYAVVIISQRHRTGARLAQNGTLTSTQGSALEMTSRALSEACG